MAGKNPVFSHRGLCNPKRGTCTHCGKKGLGKQRAIAPFGVFRDCRYCHKLTKVL